MHDQERICKQVQDSLGHWPVSGKRGVEVSAGFCSVLKPWDVVRIMIRDSGQWITDVVYRLRPETGEIDVGLEPLQAVTTPLPGDDIKIKYVSASSEILLSGKAVTGVTNFPPSMSVSVQEEHAFPYAREAKRFDVNLSAIVKADSSHENGTFASINNISASGMSFCTNLDISELLGLRLTNPDLLRIYTEVFIRPDKILSLEGNLVRDRITEQGYDYGMRFMPGANKRLQMYLFTLEDEEEKLKSKHQGFQGT